MTLNLVNAMGKEISSITLNEENKDKITVENLESGIYFLTGQAKEFGLHKKIIVER